MVWGAGSSFFAVHSWALQLDAFVNRPPAAAISGGQLLNAGNLIFRTFHLGCAAMSAVTGMKRSAEFEASSSAEDSHPIATKISPFRPFAGLAGTGGGFFQIIQ
jgi:hypothetical protein